MEGGHDAWVNEELTNSYVGGNFLDNTISYMFGDRANESFTRSIMHEMGHQMNICHQSDGRNLMQSGSSGLYLTQNQLTDNIDNYLHNLNFGSNRGDFMPHPKPTFRQN
jgi:hypothetical protein